MGFVKSKIFGHNEKMESTEEANPGTVFYNFNTPPGLTCPQAGECESWCYAKTGRYLFPSVKNKMKKNYELSQRDDFGFIVDQELQRLQRKQPDKKIYIRWNDAGDIYDASYFSKLVSIAWRNMNVNFYSYTKSVKLVKDAIAGGLMIPPNYHITFSFGGKQDDLIQPEDRQAKVFGTAEEAEECWHDASHNDMVTYNEQKICLPYHGIKGRFKR